jgi:hypothetical protein
LFITEIVVVVVALLFLAPFYFVLANSIKPYGEIVQNAASWPAGVHIQNYIRAWNVVDFPLVFVNSVLVTTFSIGGMVLLGAMAAWRMVRRPHRVSNLIFVLFVASMVIPFQSVMIPMVKVANVLQLIDTIPGVIVIYFGFGMPLTVFLLHGFTKNVPRELEEYHAAGLLLGRPATVAHHDRDRGDRANPVDLERLPASPIGALQREPLHDSSGHFQILRAVSKPVGRGAGHANHGNDPDHRLLPLPAAVHHPWCHSGIGEGLT